MPVQLIVKETDYREQITGSVGAYQTVRGATTRWADVGDQMYDGMLQAQINLGQVSWTDLSAAIAKGTAYNQTHGHRDRVLVIDGSAADAVDVIDAMLWLTHEDD